MGERYSRSIGHVLIAIVVLCCLVPGTLGAAQAAAPQAPIAARLAVAAITVTPTTVDAGDTVSITGTGFTAGEAIDVLLQPTSASAGSLPLGPARQADPTGAFATGNITVPASVPAGSYQVAAVGRTSGRIARVALSVTAPKPTLTVDPTTFAPDDDITISGAKFAPNEKVTLTLATVAGTASVALGQAQADENGAVAATKVHVPFGVPAGALQIIATGQTSSRQVMVKVTVNVSTPTLTIAPIMANPGDTVAITGTHFQPGETVNVDLVALATSTRVGTAQVGQNGSFTITTIKVPQNTPQGSVSLVATGATSRLSAVAKLTVGAPAANLTIAPDTLHPGDTVSITATGFIPGETVSVQLTGKGATPITLLTGIAGPDGSFTATKITIPVVVAAGSYTLVAAGQASGRAASSPLTVQAPPPAAPVLTIIDPNHTAGTPYKLSPGGLVQLAGANFPTGTPVTFALVSANGTTPLGIVSTNSAGVVGPIGLTLPANIIAGTYTLQASVGGNKVASVDVQVAILAPRLTASSATLSPGATLTVHGSGFAPGEQIVLALNGAALSTKSSTVLADAQGAFTVSFVVPATINDGANTLTASGASSRASFSINLQADLAVNTRFYFANGDTTADHRTVLSMVNPTGSTAKVSFTFLYQAAAARSYSQTIPAHTSTSLDLALVAGSGQYISTILESDQKIGAESTVNYGSGDASTALGAGAPGNTWYLAEGYTGGSFHEFITIMNPNTTFSTVDVRFLPFNNQPPREVRFSVGPRSLIRFDAGQYMPAQSISTIVTADKGVVVERTMRFGVGGRGAHDKIGINTASTVWLFAQGESSATRQTFLTILNPNQAAPAAVTATFFDVTGKPVGTRTITVNPLRRGNIKLNDVLSNAQVATILTSNVPVVVERPMYEGPADLGQAQSGSVVFGRNGGGTSWLFPGGTTANGNQTRVYMFNQGLKAAQVTATFYTTSGTSAKQSFTLPPNSVSVLNDNSVTGLPAGSFGTVLASTNGQVFIAEQSIVNPTLHTATSTQGIAQ